MKTRRVSKAVLSWKRANRLATLAEHAGINQTRSYLATKPPGIKDLDTNADKRTATIRDLVNGFRKWLDQSKDGAKEPREPRPTRSADLQVIYELRDLQRKYEINAQELLKAVQILATLTDEQFTGQI